MSKLNILALSSGERSPLFQKVYRFCKNTLKYDIYAVVSSKSLDPYNSFIDSEDKLILMPQITEAQTGETDVSTIARISSLISACEKITGIPAHRLLLANERTIGRAYSKYHYYWPERKLARLVLKDKLIAYTVLIRLFKFADDVISQVKPAFCLGSPVGGMWNSIFYYVATYYNIPYVACNTSLVTKNRHFWATNWGTFNIDVGPKFQEKQKRCDEPRKSSLEYIKSFRDRPASFPHYHLKWAALNASNSFININREIIKRLIIRVIPMIKRLKVSNPKPVIQFIVDRYRNFFLSRWQKGLYRSFSEETLSTMKYVYYPFHVEPEMVLNMMAPTWHNQLNTIKMLSYNLPMNYRLLVREHRINVGRRPTAYLKEISQFPGVVLINAYDDQYKYIKNAGLIVTVNGTTGFEGILLKRPVLTLDRTFYDDLNIAKKAFDYPDLGAAIMDAIYSFKIDDQYDNRIALFLDAENETTLDENVQPEDEYFQIKKAIAIFSASSMASSSSIAVRV